MVTLLDLREFAPAGNDACLKAMAAEWGRADVAGINTPLRVCHFMSQMSVESAGFRNFEENLSYSAKRLTQVWPKRFPSIASAIPFERNPQALAEKVYGGRMGNTEKGDGYRYRGRGPKQITGRSNYREIGKRIGVDLVKDPDALLKPEIGFRAAIAYWEVAGCNRWADKNDIRGVTKAVNGGYVGLADRRAAFRKAVEIWGQGEVSEIGGKGPLTSNIGRASLLAGGLTAGGIADVAYQVAQVTESGRSISEATGLPLLTIGLLAAVLGLLGYIIYDRVFMARHEGL